MRIVVVLVLAMGTVAFAAVPTLDVILNIRESADIEGIENIGGNGGTSGSYENIDYGHELVLDGTWQYFEFDLANANANGAVTGWITGDGNLDGGWGTIEAIMLRGTAWGRLEYWVDAVHNTGDTLPTVPNLGDFDVTLAESFQNQEDGAAAMFWHPGWSGSTSGLAESDGGVDNTVGYDDSSSLYGTGKLSGPLSIRQTSYDAWDSLPYGNPMVALEMNSVVSFWIKGVPEPASLALLALGGLVAIRRR